MRDEIKDGANRGFTLTELLVCLAIIALLAGICLPALATASGYTKAMVCMDNVRKLTLGWLMYANDHNGRLVANDFYRNPSKTSWASGYMDWTKDQNNTNELYIIDPEYAKLATYVDRDKRVFKCPGDRYVSSFQRSAGFKERVRSVSMSVYMGDGEEKNRYATNHTIYKQITDLKKLSPMNAWVFQIEHPDSIGSVCLLMDLTVPQWLDMPASEHNGATVLSFADGHVELRKWMAPETVIPVTYGWIHSIAVTNQTDWRWLADRTSERR